jgi:putative transposase
MGKTSATGQQFWARGYYVSTVGRNEEVIKKYIQEQQTGDWNN